jgi:hypothetical protein
MMELKSNFLANFIRFYKKLPILLIYRQETLMV